MLFEITGRKLTHEKRNNMSLRTDLALESAQALKASVKQELSGISQKEYKQAGCSVTQITVETQDAANQLGKPMGQYVTIEMNSGALDSYSDDFEEQVNMIAGEIKRLVPESGDALVIGLGNNDITPDALGPMTARQIFATRHIPKNVEGLEEFSGLRSVSSIAPGVLGQTGIEVAEVAGAVCQKVAPSVIVAIDALACSEISRLGTTIQISDTGISPGSGVKNSRKELSKNTLNAPVIAIGVPTVVDMHTIAQSITGKEQDNSEFSEMMVTPRSIDKLIERSAKLIALSVNKAFQPDMTIEDITSLI
jgi:spore protease